MPETDPHPVEKAVKDAAWMLKGLDPGPLAELRRMDPRRTDSNGAPHFWRLAAQHPETIAPGREEDWMTIIKILAILTPRGDPENREPLHNDKRALGAVLCDGGNLAWPDSNPPRPALSERRFAQLLAARGKQRPVLFTRAMLAVSRTYQSGSGVNVADIAWTLLTPNPGDMKRRLAKSYYRQLDRALRNSKKDQEGAKE